MSFRPATVADEDLFWFFRERAESQPWYGGKRTTREEHGEWFRDRLGKITLLVWNYEGRAAGTVRIDSNGEVAFSANELLMAKMLAELLPWASKYGGRLKVTVDGGNLAAARALRDSGFKEFPVKFFVARSK